MWPFFVLRQIRIQFLVQIFRFVFPLDLLSCYTIWSDIFSFFDNDFFLLYWLFALFGKYALSFFFSLLFFSIDSFHFLGNLIPAHGLKKPCTIRNDSSTNFKFNTGSSSIENLRIIKIFLSNLLLWFGLGCLLLFN